MQTKKRYDQGKKISIGIPTYEAGISLVAVIDSISSQTCYRDVEKILIVIDGNTISSKVLSKIKEKKVKIVAFKTRKGQSARINDIFSLLNSEKIVLTNDDVVLEKTALEAVYKIYEDYDLIAGNVQPVKEDHIFENSLIVGQKVRASIAKLWNGGNNYLSCNGRLIILSKKLYKQLSIPEKIWNNDAYIYLMCQKLKLKFSFAKEIVAYYKSPSTIKEHMSQSDKFQKSTMDLQRYFRNDISKFYKIPFSAIVKGLIINSLKYPHLFAAYLLIFIMTRLKSYFTKADFWFQSFWQTDPSTKSITNL